MSRVLASSFRDPSGFLFRRDGILYRQVNDSFKADFDELLSSGLYETLQREGLLIPHEESDRSLAPTADAYKVIRPEVVPFISYPYEWCFSQLKDAALATLRIQKIALEHDMSLRDASAYNIQFHRLKPVLIDTLSFERLEEGRPWVAYRQFCQHFLAPLALMSLTDVRLAQLLGVHIDGIPLDLATSLLPGGARLRGGLLMHLFAHSGSQRRHQRSGGQQRQRDFSRRAFEGLIESLVSTVTKLEWAPAPEGWVAYYQERESYSDESLDHKRELVGRLVAEAAPETVWDLGANVGVFSRIASSTGAFTLSAEMDPGCVESNYRAAVTEGEEKILPLVMDLTNPSPAIGWANEEREQFAARGPADLALALALIHHLAIGNNVPLARVASYFSSLAHSLVIEFVPKEDPMVQELLATRADVFTTYDQAGFEAAFTEHYSIEHREPLRASDRVLYLMRRK